MAALLSPFDRLIHNRKRIAEIFGFDYQLETYKPAAKRRWGYVALPILFGDALVGKLDAAADRDAGVPAAGQCPVRDAGPARHARRCTRRRARGPDRIAAQGEQQVEIDLPGAAVPRGMLPYR